MAALNEIGFRRRVRAHTRTNTGVNLHFAETGPFIGPVCSIMEHNLLVGHPAPSRSMINLEGLFAKSLYGPDFLS